MQKDASGYVALSFDNLQTAWQAQAAREVPESKRQEGDDGQTGSDVASADIADSSVIVEKPGDQEVPIEQARSEIVGGVQLPTAASVVSTTIEEDDSVATTQTTEPSSRPIDLMLASWSFMEQHLTMDVSHPFATSCAKCQHQLMSSPTKDESVPHCAWAARLRYLQFFQLKPEIAKTIPVCRQFAPKDSWAQIIPAHPQKVIMPREWIKHQIQKVVNKQSQNHYRTMFEFLTGRPMSSDENHCGWFLDQLNEQEHTLSDEQLWTLMVWALAESERLERSSLPKWKRKEEDLSFLIPIDSTNSHFVQVREIEVREGEFA